LAAGTPMAANPFRFRFSDNLNLSDRQAVTGLAFGSLPP
jgi:hypothetical protein